MIRKWDDSLYTKLEEYGKSDYYPFHMPGHKRQVDHPFLREFGNPYEVDITEIDGFDNLHHPEGILKESMRKMASYYGADHSYYLVNGSSCGILSAICGTTHNSDTILMSRNCHKAAYHGVFLNQLNVVYTYPQIIREFGVQGGLSTDEIEDMLKTYVDISSVFVVSPTYDGIVSNIQKISTICHNYGVPLIVDEAHGAHFRYGEKLPVSALDLGADVVIQSLHKTLPSFTQTAVMHVKEGYVDVERIEHYLQIFQSSSPSYIFMAGMERCVEYMNSDGEDGGKGQMGQFLERLEKIREELKDMKKLRLLDRDVVGSYEVYDLDPSKVVVSTRGAGIGGEQLEVWLRERYHLEMEMCSVDYVTAITTLMDTEEGLLRLKDAFLEIDRQLQKNGKEAYDCSQEIDGCERENGHITCIKKSVMTIHQAWNSEKEQIRIEESAGRTSGEYIYVYPPGIPLIVPGEMISEEIVNTVLQYKREGLSVQGLKDYQAEYILVVR